MKSQSLHDGDHLHDSSNLSPTTLQESNTTNEVKEVQAMVKNIMNNTHEPLLNSDRNWPDFASLITQA